MTSGKNFKIDKKHRLISMIVLAAILVVMLLSSCYIVKEADHDCSGASCPVCAVVQQCEDNLRQIGSASVPAVAAAAVLGFFIRAVSFAVFNVSIETPIVRKVRLNN